jgi:cytochrome c biogenesis protein CcmG/thiol:disulfide interchange protein DsbE
VRALPCGASDLVAAAAAYRDAGCASSASSTRPPAGRQDYLYVTDPGSRAASGFGVFGIPETFCIGRRGRVMGQGNRRVEFPLLADTLDQLLAGSTPAYRQTGRVQPAPGG